jgi:hypothetical protein
MYGTVWSVFAATMVICIGTIVGLVGAIAFVMFKGLQVRLTTGEESLSDLRRTCLYIEARLQALERKQNAIPTI